MIVTLHNVMQLIQDLDQPVVAICPVFDTGKKKWWLFWKPTRKFFEVLIDITIQLTSGEVIVVNRGFKTDLSSVPQIFWAIFTPYGNFLLAAIMHDYLYVNHERLKIEEQEVADREMLIWSIVLNSNITDNLIRYRMVRWFGKSWWNHNKSFIH